MKIAIVCFNINWPAGGPRLLYSSARAWKKMGHEVVIYVPEFTGEYFKELWQGLDIRVVKPREPFVWEGRPGFFKWIKKKIKQERLHIDTAKRVAEAMDADFEVVNLHDYAYRVAPFYKKRNPRAKILWSSNDPPYAYLPKKNPLKSILSRAYNKWRDVSGKKYFRAIDGVVVLDVYNKKWCERRGFNAKVVHLGVDFDKFYLPLRDFAPKARDKKIRLMGIGALNAYRRYEDTIMAVKFLRDWGYKPELFIICSDTWHESEHRKELLDLVSENGLDDAVTLRFEGAQDDEIKEEMRKSDALVYVVYLPPPRDGFGFSIAVLEAMAAGMPVILCRTTTSEEVLTDNETTLFVDPMSPKQIAEKAKMFIDDPAFYAKIAKRGQELVRDELTWEKYAENVLAAAGSGPAS